MTTVGDRAEVGGSEAIPREDVSLLVRGVSPVLEVPFTPDGAIDTGGFRRVVRYVLSTGVTSMMFPGFASEFHKLSEDERWELTEILLTETRANPDVAAIVADEAYGIGTTLARAAAAGLLKKELPPFLAVDAIAITKDNLKEGWQQSLHRDPPASLSEAQ